MSKKTSIIIVISVVVIILSLAISIYMPNKDKINEKKEDSKTSYYLIRREEKFGVIDRDGNIVIEPEYEEIDIPNIHREVFICKNGEESKVLNSKNEEIFKKYKNVQAIELINVITESAYENKVLIYEKNGKYGLVGIGENTITEAKYEEIFSLGFKEGEIIVKENGKYGMIDGNGNIKIKIEYDSINSDQFYCAEHGYKRTGYIVCNITQNGYRYGYFDYEGEKILDVEYNQITRIIRENNHNEICLIVAKNGQYGLYIDNNKIINTQYQSIEYSDSIGMFIVERTNKYGAMNEKGLEILKTEYDEIKVNGIYMYTKKGEEQKVFDRIGKEIEIDFSTVIQATSNSNYYIKVEGEKHSILNSNLEEVLEQKFNYLEYINGDNFVSINDDGKLGIINVLGEKVIEFEFDIIQIIKGKNAIQASEYENNLTIIYNNELKEQVRLNNMNIQTLENYIKVYNENEEYYLDVNGNKIEDEGILESIKESNAILRIGNYKRVTYGVEKYYYIEEN